MKYITRDDSIEILHFSNRIYNSLRRMGIDIVDKLITCSQEELQSARNLGAKSVAEIMATVDDLRRGEGEYRLVDADELPTLEESTPEITFDAESDSIFEDAPIGVLDLSVRAVNCLRNAGIENVSQLIDMTRDDLMRIKNMGRKTAELILDEVEAYKTSRRLVSVPSQTERESSAKGSPMKTPGPDEELVLAFAEKQLLTTVEVKRQIALLREEHPEAAGETLLFLLFGQDVVRERAKARILRHLEEAEDTTSVRELFSLFPTEIEKTTVLEQLLLDMEREKTIYNENGLIRRRWPSVTDFVTGIKDERAREILFARLEGKTLAASVGDAQITRERVRQIINKYLLRGHPRLEEDKYAEFFSQYATSCEEFTIAFGEPISTYNYLYAVYHKTWTKPLSQCLTDETLPLWIRKGAEKAVFRDYVTLNGVRVKKTRQELVRYVVRTFCQEPTLYKDFVSVYEMLLGDLGIQDEEKLQVSGRGYENKFSDSLFCLTSYNHHFRYYNIEAADSDALLSTIDFSQYQDKAVSALKLFRDYSELMAEYDIRNEYELHNFLKKTWCEDIYPGVEFGRMPMLFVGEVDRERQTYELMREYVPIGVNELAKIFEETYGVLRQTAIGTWFRAIDAYYHDGLYSVPEEELTSEQYRHMQELLPEDYYLIDDIRRCFGREYQEADPTLINSYTLKKLGFRVYASFVIRDTYANSTEYFTNLLTKNDIVDAREFPHSMRRLQAYSAIVLNLRHDRTIIEYAPLQYIHRRRLEQAGVTMDVIEGYCRAVSRAVEPGEFFTIRSLRGNGFSHPLDDLGFDDWFYASILEEDRKRFSVQRVSNTKLLFAGIRKIVYTDFLQWLIEREGKLEVYELIDRLDRDYGIQLERAKLFEMIKDTELYYDEIMETVYDCYDTYFEEA